MITSTMPNHDPAATFPPQVWEVVLTIQCRGVFPNEKQLKQFLDAGATWIARDTSQEDPGKKGTVYIGLRRKDIEETLP